MRNESSGKAAVEQYKYYFFDKEELLERYNVTNYDDILCVFKFGDQWYGSIWSVLEKEVNVIDYRAANSSDDATQSAVTSLVKEFHKKFFDMQQPSKGFVVLPDANSYRVPATRRDDDCGDLVMAFFYLYSIGSLLFEINLTPPKRANFSLAFAWMLLKIYHEEEYHFRRNVAPVKPTTRGADTAQKLVSPKQQSFDHSSTTLKGSEDGVRLPTSNDGFDFAAIMNEGDTFDRPAGKKEKTFKEHVRYTPIPKKDEIIEERHGETNEGDEDEDDDDMGSEFRRKKLEVVTDKEYRHPTAQSY